MNTIKFNHEYFKLLEINTRYPVTLLLVNVVHKEELCKAFIEYDTQYLGENGIESYELPNTTLILLTFIDIDGNLFITSRKWNKDKMYFYKETVGQDYQVQFVGGEI